MENNYIQEQKYIRAKKKVKEIKGFYIHFAVYIIINIFISGIIVYGLTRDEEYNFSDAITHFGVYSTWLFWGIGVFFHWLGVFGFKSVLSQSWEDRKIKELMEKEEQRSKSILKK